MPKAAKMEMIPFLPGRWIDFSDPDNICVREADGTFVGGPLYITEEDAAKLKRILSEFADILGLPQRKRAYRSIEGACF
jgi:hypothetical protein